MSTQWQHRTGGTSCISKSHILNSPPSQLLGLKLTWMLGLWQNSIVSCFYLFEFIDYAQESHSQGHVGASALGMWTRPGHFSPALCPHVGPRVPGMLPTWDCAAQLWPLAFRLLNDPTALPCVMGSGCWAALCMCLAPSGAQKLAGSGLPAWWARGAPSAPALSIGWWLAAGHAPGAGEYGWV